MVRSLSIPLLRSFVTVVERGSFTVAGQQLGRCQSAVSCQIRRLEAELGHRLLDRSPKHVTLTPLGQSFLPHARRMIAVHDDTVGLLRNWPLAGRGLPVPPLPAPPLPTPPLPTPQRDYDLALAD
jgi:DNA-binding transcriptional LysR family regulator